MKDETRVNVERYLAGDMEPAEAEEFLSSIRDDSEALRYLGDSLLQHSLIFEVERENVRAMPRRNIVPHTGSRVIWMSAAAAFVVAVIAMYFVFPKGSQGTFSGSARGVEKSAVVPETPLVSVPRPEPTNPRVEPAPTPEPAKEPIVARPPEPAPVVEPVAPKLDVAVVDKPAPTPVVTPEVGHTELPWAHVESAQGDVQLTGAAGTIAAKAGQELFAGQELRTIGRESVAAVKFRDGTRFELGPDSSIVVLRATGKSVYLTQGALTADVVKQPASRPMIITTPQAQAEILGTRLTLCSGSDSTRLYVIEGIVRLTRRLDGAAVDVTAGFYADAALPINFMQQDPPKPIPFHPKVDQTRVDAVIEKGCKFLLGNIGEPFSGWGRPGHRTAVLSYLELIVLTLVHSGNYPEDHPQMAPLIEQMVGREIGSVYTASLQAMALQKINPRKYQWRIAQCAQYLVDNQALNGQWEYGDPTKVDHFAPPKAPESPAVLSTGGSAKKATPSPSSRAASTRLEAKFPKIPVVRNRRGPPTGDNSNSQYAALGLRACLDSGIILPTDVLTRAREWWLKSQNTDGGWGYNEGGAHDGSGEKETGTSNSSYGSMTVGGVGALCIYKFFLGEEYKNDPSVTRGVAWITRNYDVKKNPKKNLFDYLYYLYGLERAGMIYGIEKFGANEWYPDGANYLLETQTPTGAWYSGSPEGLGHRLAGGPQDTCFSILFLRRGTVPLKPPPEPPKIATGVRDDSKKKEMKAAEVKPLEGKREDAAAPPLDAALQSFAPGWMLMNCGKSVPPGSVGEYRGKKNVFRTYPQEQTACSTLRKKLDVPAGKKTTLHLVVGHDRNDVWLLMVRVDGKVLLVKLVDNDSAPQTWTEVDVDLSAYAGEGVMVELLNQRSGSSSATGYWAEIDLKTQ